MLCCICKSPEHKAIDCELSWYRRPASHREEQGNLPRDRNTPETTEDASAGSENPPPCAGDASDAQPDAPFEPPAATSPPEVTEEHVLDSQGLFISEVTPANLPQQPPCGCPFA